MAALLHIDVLRQHMLSPSLLPDFDSTVTTVPATSRLRPVACWQISPNGRPVCHWMMDDGSVCVPPD